MKNNLYKKYKVMWLAGLHCEMVLKMVPTDAVIKYTTGYDDVQRTIRDSNAAHNHHSSYINTD